MYVENQEMGFLNISDIIRKAQRRAIAAQGIHAQAAVLPPSQQKIISKVWGGKFTHRKPAPAPPKATPYLDKYPGAGDDTTANLWHQLITNPKAFYNVSMQHYDQQPTPETKAQYAKFIGDAIRKLYSQNPNLALGQLAKLTQGETMAWVTRFVPGFTAWTWVLWAQRDLNAFLNAHLKNIEALPADQQLTHGAELKKLMDENMPENFLEKASDKNKQRYLKIAEPELYEELLQQAQTAQAAAITQQNFGRIMGVGILAVIGLGLFSAIKRR